MKYIIVQGDPVDGFSFIGPFDDHAVAVEYADSGIAPGWWVCTLDEPQPAAKYDGPVYRCPHCNSDEVYNDAYANMNDPDDVQVFDEKVCQACGEHFDEAIEDNGDQP